MISASQKYQRVASLSQGQGNRGGPVLNQHKITEGNLQRDWSKLILSNKLNKLVDKQSDDKYFMEPQLRKCTPPTVRI